MADKKNETAAATTDRVDTHVPSRTEKANMQPDKDYQAATTGAVTDPNDGRLKENRDAGISLGTTAHSAQAPNVGRSDDK